MTSQKTIATLLAVILLTSSQIFAQDEDAGSLKIDKGSKIVISSYKGSIKINTWDRDEVVWKYRIEADEDFELVEKTSIDMKRKDGGVVFKTNYDRAKKKTSRFFGLITSSSSVSLPFAHYELTIPNDSRVKIDDYKSEIVIRDIGGDLVINNYKGPIDIRNGNSSIEINSYRSPIDIEDLNGSLDLNTYKGEIHVSMTDLDNHTSFDTYRGEVFLMLPESEAFSVEANMGRSKQFVCDFDQVKKKKSNVYVGKVNGGGPAVTMSTYKGSFEISSN